jgi:hypothetical protein
MVGLKRVVVRYAPNSAILKLAEEAQMAKDWTPGGFDGMDDDALRRFYRNAQWVVERKDPKLTERALELMPLIEAEFNRRNVSRPVPSPQNK